MNWVIWRLVGMMIGLLGFIGCAGERPTNLGAKEGQLQTCPASPNCVSSQSVDERHRIPPLAFSGDPDVALARLRQILGQRPDTSVLDESAGYLRVEFRTVLFVDDGEFLLDRAARAIHVRSASRIGYSDLGKNRSRMEDIRRQFYSSGRI